MKFTEARVAGRVAHSGRSSWIIEHEDASSAAAATGTAHRLAERMSESSFMCWNISVIGLTTFRGPGPFSYSEIGMRSFCICCPDVPGGKRGAIGAGTRVGAFWRIRRDRRSNYGRRERKKCSMEGGGERESCGPVTDCPPARIFLGEPCRHVAARLTWFRLVSFPRIRDLHSENA